MKITIEIRNRIRSNLAEWPDQLATFIIINNAEYNEREIQSYEPGSAIRREENNFGNRLFSGVGSLGRERLLKIRPIRYLFRTDVYEISERKAKWFSLPRERNCVRDGERSIYIYRVR